MEQQFDSATLGMWVFLLTEIMFFGGMFGAYTVYRNMYPDAFASTSMHMNPAFGAANTAVLIVSSLTMALAVRAAHLGQQKAPAVLPGPHHDLRRRLPGDQGIRVSRTLGRHESSVVPRTLGLQHDAGLRSPSSPSRLRSCFAFTFS